MKRTVSIQSTNDIQLEFRKSSVYVDLYPNFGDRLVSLNFFKFSQICLVIFFKKSDIFRKYKLRKITCLRWVGKQSYTKLQSTALLKIFSKKISNILLIFLQLRLTYLKIEFLVGWQATKHGRFYVIMLS